MPEENRTEKPDERMTVIEAQDALAASIPEIESLAWRFFAIARDLEAPEQDEDFDEQEPGPEHLRWFTALGAMAIYSELLELVPYIRRNAECTHADIMDQWRRQQAAEENQEITAALPICIVKPGQEAKDKA